jgi:flagellar hook protein FlgE
LRVIADTEGPSSQRIDLIDEPANSGGTRFNEHTFVEEVEGKDNDTVETTLQLFDLRGQAHNINVTFSKVDKNSWDAEFDLIDNDGVFFDNIVRRIEFAENGAFLGAFGTGTEGGSIEVRFDQMNFSQIVDLDFSELTHLANRFTASVNQNGFPPGNLVNVAVNVNGVLEGIASNGRRVPIAQMAIATFFNNLGLEAVGQNYFRESTNSGVPRIGEANAGSAGAVRGGQLESSNVDVALEFTQLIVAQRGFSANARTITVANEVLQELTSILR